VQFEIKNKIPFTLAHAQKKYLEISLTIMCKTYMKKQNFDENFKALEKKHRGRPEQMERYCVILDRMIQHYKDVSSS